MSLLSMTGAPTKSLVETACARLLDYGVGQDGTGTVIIRSGAMGAYVASRSKPGRWVPAFWTSEDASKHVVDVTGLCSSDISDAWQITQFLQVLAIVSSEVLRLDCTRLQGTHTKVRSGDSIYTSTSKLKATIISYFIRHCISFVRNRARRPAQANADP